MRPRQRIPVIFSLSMLDVLCCGLGAVIFLMILYSWDARRQAKSLVLARIRVGETAERLTAAEANLSETLAALKEQGEERDKALARLANITHQSQETQQRLATAQRNLDALKKQLAEAERLRQEAAAVASQVPDLREELIHAQQSNLDLSSTLTQERKLAMALRDRLKLGDQQLTDAGATASLVPGLRKDLTLATERVKNLEAMVADRKTEVDKTATGLATAQQRTKELEAEIATLKSKALETSAHLTDTQQALTVEKGVSAALRRQGSLDARFAGVDLGGKRVVIMVDTSGSMGSVDEKNADPNKWPEVCKTVGQVLNSLPHAEKYQVILFADQPRYLRGQPGQWLTYDKAKTPDEVKAALLQVKPSGNTHLYSAFDTAFQFKSQGLDTIYLFSDGLPNIGPGLPTPPPTDETVQAGQLGKYVRDSIRTRWNGQEPKVKVHAIGFFYESPSLGAFLWALTRENGGSFVGMGKP